ncbi:MAG TPA: phosphatase PAP2 family protein, partial [Rhodothermales bacterium]|nr:phosphatase PAP2 family protein [Rhodothermales bacterium]
LLVVVFAVVLARRHSDWLRVQGGRVRRWLSVHAPRVWQFVRYRFSREAWYGLTLTMAFVLCVGMIWLFMQVTESWTAEGVLYQFDRSVNEQIQGLLSDNTIQAIARLTYLGDGEFAIMASVVLIITFIVQKRWWRLLALFTILGLGNAVMWTLKWQFDRTRPDGFITMPTSSSFPSGHSFVAMVLYGFLIFLVWQVVKSRVWRVVLTTALVLIILMVGLSRVLLSVHWVSDVLGGFTIGLAWLIFGIVVTRALRDLYAYRRR